MRLVSWNVNEIRAIVGKRNVGSRIDNLHLSGAAAQAETGFHLAVIGSDHCPVGAILE